MSIPAAARKGRWTAGAPAGFTLVEVMAALAVLGVAIFVLLDAHYSALSLHQSMDEEVSMRQLLEMAVSRAELEIRAGNLSGGGEIGTRYPGYSWSFEALASGSDEMILLYDVTCTLRTPEEERQLNFFVYDTGVGSLDEPGSTSGTESVFDE